MRYILFTAVGLLLLPLACLAEPAKMGKADALLEKPFTDAKVLVRLTAGQTVDIQKREGAWYLVKGAGKTGWVRMLSVRRTAPPSAASAGSLAQVATGRAGSGRIVSTTGVRGLGEETLTEAPFNEAAVAAAEKYRIDPTEATRAARDSGLVPRKIPALPVPTTRVTTEALP